jgi:uncharacterized protein (TIGR00251 family)
MRQKGRNRRASQPGSGPCNYRNHLKRSFPPSFFDWFSSLLVEPGNESLDNDMTVVSLVVSIRVAISVPGFSLSCQLRNDREGTDRAVPTIWVHVIPNAKVDQVVGEHGDAIKIKLRAPAIEGKANTALRRFLTEKLSIPQRVVVLEHGERSRDKLIRIDGLSDGDIRQRLLEPS